MEILDIMKESRSEPQQKKESTQCPLFCKIELDLDTYTDHIIQCEKKIETCKNCGNEFNKNQIHRELEIHSKATQRFSCIECMQARKVRLDLIQYHKNNCLDSKKEKKYKKVRDRPTKWR